MAANANEPMPLPRVEEGGIPPGKAAPFCGPCRLLVSLDYDGTLRSPQGSPVGREFFELMAAWRSKGLRWGINTGRNMPYLMSDLLPCSPVLPDFICTCERYVYMADGQGRLIPATGHNEICLRANMELREKFRPVLHAALEAIRSAHPGLPWLIAPSDPLSIETPDAAAMDALMPHLQPLAPEGVAIQRAGRYLRFSDARFSKGTALQYIVQQWQVPQSGLMLMGDGHNDLYAFRLFPQAFCAAPADAHPEVAAWLRRRGGFVSPEAGVLQALREWMHRMDEENLS